MAASSMRPYATRLASAMKGTEGVRSRIQDGFVVRAVSKGDNVTVYVLELAGVMAGVMGNWHRYNHERYPLKDYVVSFARMTTGPISSTIGSTGTLVDIDPPEVLFKGGGVHVGGELVWDSTHNTLTTGKVRACVMPSAILYPSVAGGSGAAGNKSVLIQRLNAQSGKWDGVGGVFAAENAILLNKALHDAGIERLSHIELAAAALPTGDYSLTAGLSSCVEWGARTGAVTYNAIVPAVPGTLATSYENTVQRFGGVPPTSSEMTVVTGTLISQSRFDVYSHTGSWSASAYKSVFLSRYEIASDILPPDADGVVKQEHTGSVLWTVALDGATATDALAWMTYSATTSPETYTTPLPVTWTDLWRWEDMLVWSSNAGVPGGELAPGEKIIVVGTVRVRQKRIIQATTQAYPQPIAAVKYPPEPVYVEETHDLDYYYHDRHLVRATIDPATGSATYESLYQFVNCDTTPLYYSGKHATGNDASGNVGFSTYRPYSPVAAQDTEVLSEYRHTPLCGFTWLTPATVTDTEVRRPYVACQRITQAYDLLPPGYFSPQSQGCPGTPGTGAEGPIYSSTGGQLLVPEGSIYFSFGYVPFGGNKLSLASRQPARNPLKADLADGRKIVLIGATGGEVVMDTGAYYPVVLPPPAPVRLSSPSSTTSDYYPDSVDLGSPVCQYAPGVVAIAVIPKSQYPEPRPFYPHPPAYNEIEPASSYFDYPYYSGIGGDDVALADYRSRWAALRALPPLPAVPPPLPQDYYIALCSVTTGALLAVSAVPFHTSTAIAVANRGATVALSCMELGEVDALSGALTKHGGLLITVREPVDTILGSKFPGGRAYFTWDLCVSVKPYSGNQYAAPLHYLGTPLTPAQIGVTTGIAAVKGLRISVTPP
jgi:hypothetical protein